MIKIKSEADEIAEHTEEMLTRLKDMGAENFTLGDIIWLNQIVKNVRWGTTVEAEVNLNKQVASLLERVGGFNEG